MICVRLVRMQSTLVQPRSDAAASAARCSGSARVTRTRVALTYAVLGAVRAVCAGTGAARTCPAGDGARATAAAAGGVCTGSSDPIVPSFLHTCTQISPSPIARSRWLRTAQVHRTTRWLVRACRRVAEASEHAGRRDASGMVLVGDHQTRAMSKSHPHEAASTAGLAVPLSLAHDGFARLKSTARRDGS